MPYATLVTLQVMTGSTLRRAKCMRLLVQVVMTTARYVLHVKRCAVNDTSGGVIAWMSDVEAGGRGGGILKQGDFVSRYVI